MILWVEVSENFHFGMKINDTRLNGIIQIAEDNFVFHRSQFREFTHDICAINTGIRIDINHSASAACLGFAKSDIPNINFLPVVFLE
jgi:hypothetical protein